MIKDTNSKYLANKYLKKDLIEPTEIVGGAIAIFKNFYKDSDKITEEIEKIVLNNDHGIKFEKAREYNTVTLQDTDQSIAQRDCMNLIINRYYLKNTFFMELGKKIQSNLWYALASYFKTLDIKLKLYSFEPIALLKYSGGQKHGKHYDGPTSSKRGVSAILYLNDNYEGGEIEFPYHNIKIKPEAGMLLLFPPNYAYAHIAHPVTSGTKYAFVTWIHDQE